jgi:hypothetical protein
MTETTTAHAAIGMSWKIRKILRGALGDDFAATNTGITPSRDAAWFWAVAGPDPWLKIKVEVWPEPEPGSATPEEETLIEGLEEALAYFRSRES